MADVVVLQIGDFGETSDLLPRPANLKLARAQSLSAALESLVRNAAPLPELIVLAESGGGEASQSELAELRRLAPLARVWRLLGPWCEGEARSGRPPVATISTYWHRFAARFVKELDARDRGLGPAWSLPLTATAEERLLAESELPAAAPRLLPVAIHASSAVAAEALADLCRERGHAVVLDPSTGSALLWDATPRQIADPACVADALAGAGHVPVLAIVGFPRPDDVAHALSAGIFAVVSKPFLAGELFWHLDRAANRGKSGNDSAPTG